MQDRFKYRLWHKPLKTMHYNDFVITATGYMAKIYQQDDYMMKFNQEDLEFDKQCILMQCTGLKDKNGKLIYEGDIVKTYPSGFFDAYTDIFFIKNNLCGFYLATPYKNMSGDWECQDTIGCYNEKEYEVIGNIYENPELLED